MSRRAFLAIAVLAPFTGYLDHAPRWIVAATVPVAIVRSLGARSLLAVLYTPQYAEASVDGGVSLGTLIATDAFTDADAQMAAEFSPTLRE